jgi:hypothetical protein
MSGMTNSVRKKVAPRTAFSSSSASPTPISISRVTTQKPKTKVVRTERQTVGSPHRRSKLAVPR